MNTVATVRKATLAAITAIALGVAVPGAITPANAGPGYGNPHHHGHFNRHRHVYGGAGIIGGLALGALAAGAIVAQSDCYDVSEPMVDRWGNLIRYRVIRVCD